jgi:macrophage erythroblast attacher
MKRNLKRLQKLDEKQLKKTDELVSELSKCSGNNEKRFKLKQIIASMKTYEKKMKLKVEAEKDLLTRLRERVSKLNELKILKDACSRDAQRPDLLNDNKLLNWYREQTNLLVADYLLKNDRNIDTNSGQLLLKSLQFENLIDSDVILLSNRISSMILNHDLTALVQWINDNKSYLKKIKSHLEFETRFQEYIELVKSSDVRGAIKLYEDYLIYFTRTNFHEIQLATGLLIFSNKAQFQQNNVNFQKYNKLLSDERYKYLSELFLKLYYKMHGIPEDDPLLVYLSIGVSSLKTRSCISTLDRTVMGFEDLLKEKLSGSDHLEQSSCPVCSLEFRQMNSLLPYSHNVQSHLFENPVMLPNGNIYDKSKLLTFSKVSQVSNEEVIDPLTLETFEAEEMATMYPT